ncbi:MAG: hypothetical protein IJ297_00240 [Clostridia bacterium]|nr:hypothetical protein [Clostridia bacterium]
MEENKNEILEEGTTPSDEVTETVEEAVTEETSQMIEDAVTDEENTEELEEALFVEDSSEAEKYIDVKLLIAENAALKKANKIMKGVLTTLAALVIAALVIFAGFKVYKAVYNPYNHMGYYNISGMTLEDVAEMNDMTVEEIIAELNLPKDIKADTYYDVIEYLVPVSTMAEMYGADVETIKSAFQLGDHITADSTWGEALDSMPLSVYFGDDEVLAEVIEEYNLGDNITGETLWGEIRPTINKIDYERHLAEQATDVTEAE